MTSAIESRAEVASSITERKSEVGFFNELSIFSSASPTFKTTESVFGKSAILARYSPISADIFSSFLRSSSIFLDVTSDVDVIAIVAVAVEVIFIV
ncbi:hypothetical protein [Streptococcus parasanguinis]|mgnify:FL=1|uniref:hypothetical protein n=1 Tax=Streptococcus parasanguinis TaxID=1318 RepID=UPI00399D62F7